MLRHGIIAAMLAAAVATAGCGAKATPPPAILDTEKVERAIEQSSLEQRGTTAIVSCPSGVRQRKRATFACSAVAEGVTTRFDVIQLDASGRVRYAAPAADGS